MRTQYAYLRNALLVGASPVLLLMTGMEGIAAPQDVPNTIPFTPQDLRSVPSTDTRPINIKIGLVTYAIPRNYLYYSISGLPVTLRVTYPGLQPLTEETRPCMEHKIWQTCLPIELNLDYIGNNKWMIEKTKHDAMLSHRQQNIYGYDVYEVGPDNSKSEYLFDELDNVYLRCITVIVGDAAPADDCLNFIDVDQQNGINVTKVVMFVKRKHISEIRKLDRDVQALINGFYVSRDPQ